MPSSWCLAVCFLVKTAAPTGFMLPRDTVRTFSLSYTNAKAGLASSTISAASEHHAMNAEDAARIDNERMKTDVSLHKVDASDTDVPLEGAHFRLYRDNGDGAFDPNADTVRYEGTTDENGAITFSQLTVGTYFCKRRRLPRAISSTPILAHVMRRCAHPAESRTAFGLSFLFCGPRMTPVFNRAFLFAAHRLMCFRMPTGFPCGPFYTIRCPVQAAASG